MTDEPSICTRIVVEIPLPPQEAMVFLRGPLFEWLQEQFPYSYEEAYMYTIPDPWSGQ